jgi:DNA-binding response OmpR family regulator
MSRPAGKKILVVEDEADILHLVTHYLEKEGFRLRTAGTGVQALKLVKEDRPDLIILDLMLPELDGLEVCKKIRMNADTAMIPILMLTAKAEESDTVIGLELGADDYVTKPFSPKALVARVKALLRRMDRSAGGAESIHRYNSLVIDLSRHEVKVQDREVQLTAKEFGLLEHLVRNMGRVLTRDVLLNAVWGYDYYGTTRTVDVHVRRLKQKIPLLHDAIVSVKSLGYKLRDSDSSL